MIKIGNYFKLLNIPQYFIENDWKSFIKVIDTVGLWHYSRTIPNKSEYKFDFFDEHVIITCARTRTRFHFDEDWHCTFRYLDEEGEEKNKTTTEGTLFSAFPYIDVLIEIRAIKYINPFTYL